MRIGFLGVLGFIICGFAVFPLRGSSPTGSALAHYERPSSGERYKDRVIVFVHGIYGDAKDTWTAPNGVYWPKLLLSDSAYDDSDLYVAGYDSPYWGNKATFEEIVTNLQTRLIADGVWKHREVIFVCHSMGGLLVRRLLIEYRDGYAKKVPFIYFYATPEKGSEIARLASKGSADPLLRILFPNGQAPDYLSNLETEWRKAHFGISQYCAYEKQPYPFLGVIVPRDSATRNCTEPAVGIEADHVGIVKPSSKTDEPYTALLSAALQNPVSPNQPPTQEATVQQESQKKSKEKKQQPASANVQAPLDGRQASKPAAPVATPSAIEAPNCPYGICPTAPNFGTQTVINNGSPPKLTWHKIESPTPPISAFGDVVVSLSLDRAPGTLAFSATCDRSCSSGAAVVVTGTFWDLREFINENSSNPNRAIVLMVPERPIGAGQEILWSIKSTARVGSPLIVESVEVMSEEEAGKLSRKPNQVFNVKENPIPN